MARGAHAPRTVRRPARRAWLRTADGVPIDALYEPCEVPATPDGAARAGSAGAAPGGPAVVLAHGFTGDLARPHVRRIARFFTGQAAVVTFSFRGHGRSGGRSTVGDREVADLAAAVAWARRLGHDPVITLGFSMGGSVVLRHAALQGPGGGPTTAPGAAGEPAGAPSAGAAARPAVYGGRNGAGTGGGSAARTPAQNHHGPHVGPCSQVGGGVPVERADDRGALGADLVAGSGALRAGADPGASAGVGADTHVGARTGPGAGPGTADPGAARTDAVVAVSAPARWYYRGTAPMRRLHWLVTTPVGRFVGRYGFRTRIHPYDWDPVPLSPVEAVPLIAPTPLLIVHGDRDPYFPLDHPRMLAAASGGAADLWLEPGMGHAEHATDADLLRRIGAWARRACPAPSDAPAPSDVLDSPDAPDPRSGAV